MSESVSLRIAAHRRDGRSPRRSAFAFLSVAALLALGIGQAQAQYSSGSSGIHGVFPPVPTGIPSAPDSSFILINMTTGLVRYCSGYDTTNRPDTCTAEIALAQLPGILPGELTTGVFHFTEVSFGTATASPQVYFVGNRYNRSVTILSQEDIVFLGGSILNLQGGEGGAATLALGVGLIGGRGGLPGPGGFAGGAGGDGGVFAENGAPGAGPGGGEGGTTAAVYSSAFIGGDASAAQPNTRLVPLAGGSGGGGGAGIAAGATGCGTLSLGLGGGGGGGGGGSVLLAATGEIVLGGADHIYVFAGQPGYAAQSPCSFSGGFGTAGSVRLVANHIRGTGNIWLGRTGSSAADPSGRLVMESYTNSYNGSIVHAESIVYLNAPSIPIPAGLPSLRITAVGGVAVGPNPTNSMTTPDVNFPTPPTNPVQVSLAASGIPLGTTVSVRLAPVNGNAVSSVTSTPLSGTPASSTAAAQVTVPPGLGSISAFASFPLSGSLAASLGLSKLPRIDGELPDHVEVAAGDGGGSEIFLVTSSGRRMKVGRGAVPPS